MEIQQQLSLFDFIETPQTNWDTLIQDILYNRFTDQQLAKIQDTIVSITSFNEIQEKRFAIIFSGEYRTGNEVLKRNRILFKTIFPKADFFVTTRPTYKLQHDPLHGSHFKDTEFTITEEQIKENFGTDHCYVNLVEDIYESMDIHQVPLNYIKHLYLAYKACEMKKNIEKKHEFVYDQVIHTRPDLYFRKANTIGNFIMSPLCQPDEIVGCWPEWVEMHKNWQSADLYFRMDSITHNKFCEIVNRLNDIVDWIGKNMPNKNIFAHSIIAAWVKMLDLKQPKMFNHWSYPREWGNRDPGDYRSEFAYQCIRKDKMGSLDLDNMDWYEIQSQNPKINT